MGKHVERYSTFEAMIRGHSAVANRPLEVIVSRVSYDNKKGLVDVAPAVVSAFTSRLVERICGASGIMLKGGIMIPWDRLERHERHEDLVLVRLDLRRVHSLPIVLLNSLIKG